MKKRRFPKHTIKAKVIITIAYTFLLALVFTAVTFSIAYAKDDWTVDFNAYYGTDGVKNGTTMGSCITCHNQIDGKGGDNDYGIDWFIAGGKSNPNAAFAAIEPLDSDGDGFDNISEIIDDTWPGDPSSTPGSGPWPPVADAGPDQTAAGGVLVTLNGSNSSDSDGVITTYLWEQTAGTPVTLSDASAIQPTFIAPDIGSGSDALTFMLTVTDDDSLQGTDFCIVNPPTANAGTNNFGGSSSGCFIGTAAVGSQRSPLNSAETIGWLLLLIMIGCSAVLVCLKTISQR